MEKTRKMRIGVFKRNDGVCELELYLEPDDFRELCRIVGSNRCTTVLRLAYEERSSEETPKEVPGEVA